VTHAGGKMWADIVIYLIHGLPCALLLLFTKKNRFGTIFAILLSQLKSYYLLALPES
jgi:hypothetical protein